MANPLLSTRLLLLLLLLLLQLVENHDCLFDDACAPELALDFDCQNISTGEGIMSWMMGIGAYVTLFMTIKYVSDPPSKNPAITREESDDLVVAASQHD